ncbi:hypothetical protein VTO42DRAFT_3917 [Malbranchea cinnamomea]
MISTGNLFSGDEILTTTKHIEHQFVLKYVPNLSKQPLPSVFAAKTSAKRLESPTTFNHWRSCLDLSDVKKHDDLVTFETPENTEISPPAATKRNSSATGFAERSQEKHTVDDGPGQFPILEITPELLSQATVPDTTSGTSNSASADPGFQLDTELDHLFTTHPSLLNEPL